MQPSFGFLVVFFEFVLCMRLVVAGPQAAQRRQNGDPIESLPHDQSTTASPTASLPSPLSGLDSVWASSTTLVSTTSSEAPSSTTSTTSLTTITDHPEPTPVSATPSENPLPIHPKITPAIGLSGVVLLLSGLMYAVIGIKNKWVYVFGAAAYLTALAVSVLIVYLMSPPVSDAVQGAFFVAAFFTGIIFGALSLVFSDITDGLGCLLGGFCLSMWFLSLKDGGLVSSATGRAIFIGCMSAGVYSLSFSRHTRNYGLIGSIAFSGATSAILGIDCLTRSGLKEFWLYIWNLNDNVFPLNTNTYPVTKYIKAQLAGIIIIAVFGVISQLRVWKLVEEHRANNAAQQLEKQQKRDREEEALGRKIEEDLQRERARWEAAYGDNDEQHSSVGSSITGPKNPASIRGAEVSANDSVEMIQLSKGVKPVQDAADTPPSTTIAINHLKDDSVRQTDSVGNVATGSADDPSGTPHGNIESSAPRQPPVVGPLPFTVPIEEEANSANDDLSVSAVPEFHRNSERNNKSVSKRFSDISGMKLRLSRDATYSREPLISHTDADCDVASSVAATLDEDDDVVSLYPISPLHSPLGARDSTYFNSLGAAGGDAEMALSRGREANKQASSDATQEGNQRSSEALKEVGPVQTMRQPLTRRPSPRPEEPAVEGSARRKPRGRTGTSATGIDKKEERRPRTAPAYRTSDLEDSAAVACAADDARESPAAVRDERGPAPSGRRRSSRTLGEGVGQGNSNHDLVRPGPTLSRASLVDVRAPTKSSTVRPLDDVSRCSSSHGLDGLAPLPSNTLMGQRESLLRNRVSSQSLTPKSSAANLLAEQQETEQTKLTARRLTVQQQTGPALQQAPSGPGQRKAVPAAAQKWQGKGWSATQGAPVGFDSHAPKRNSSSQLNQKREQLYAGWREKMRDATPPETVAVGVEQQRQALLSERRQRELDRQQREAQQQQRASQMDSMMRSGLMLDAHREAMRKMQADANRAR